MTFCKTNKISQIVSIIQKIIIVQTIIHINVDGKTTVCYVTTLLEKSWTDSSPEYTVNMTFSKDGGIASRTAVSRKITSPVARITIKRFVDDIEERTMYNISARLCDFRNVMEKIPMFKTAVQTSLKQGNYSFSCPMEPGVYVLAGIRINNRNPLLSFLYQPKTSYNFNGGVYEELPNKTLRALSTYNFRTKIIKKTCAA